MLSPDWLTAFTFALLFFQLEAAQIEVSVVKLSNRHSKERKLHFVIKTDLNLVTMLTHLLERRRFSEDQRQQRRQASVHWT